MKQIKMISENMREVTDYADPWLSMVICDCSEVKTQVRAKLWGLIPYWKTVNTEYVEETQL